MQIYVFIGFVVEVEENMTRFPDRQSHRLRWFDYSFARVYFVTICTHEREHFFGRIRNEIMYLNETGRISRRQASITRPFPRCSNKRFCLYAQPFSWIGYHLQKNQYTEHATTLPRSEEKTMEAQNPQLKKPYKPPKLGEIVRSFKAASTRRIHVVGTHNFAWQDNYLDEIVRNDDRFRVLCNYIRDNPKRWEIDKLYKPEP